MHQRFGLCLAARIAAVLLSPVLPGVAVAEDSELTREELLEMLEQRDVLIYQLHQRMLRLEDKVGIDAPAPQTAAPPETGAPPPPAATAEAPDTPSQGPEAEPETEPQREAGQLEVDLVAAERALERSLVAQGVSLLSFGQIEIAPSVGYSFSDSAFPTAVAAAGGVAVANASLERMFFNLGLAARIGLPLDSQFEVFVPYRIGLQQSKISINGAGFSETDAAGAGVGDVRFGIAKALWSEGLWWPAAVARITWDTNTADRFSDGISLGGGFHDIEGSLSWTSRQDPLVFFGSASYQHSFPANGIELGDELGFSVGTALSVSPVSSIFVLLNSAFVGETKVNGLDIQGSDAVAATFSLGANTVLWRNTLLNIVAGIGVTEDSTDYSLGVSLPVRLSY